MKSTGAILLILSGYLGIAATPLFFLVSAIGLLIFMQGIENSIIENTTEYVRRSIAENKTYEELETERLSLEPGTLHEQSTTK